MTLAEIIARIEAGETGRELDARIHYEVRGLSSVGSIDEFLATSVSATCPHYTTSIDASELLPGQIDEVVRITLLKEGLTTQPYMAFEASVARYEAAHAPTEAAARTAAKLKALEVK